jgi:hypothetical protein
LNLTFVDSLNDEDEVFNIEVEDFHTYFVNISTVANSVGIWVHNKISVEFDRPDADAVKDPKPQWTPQHQSEAFMVKREADLQLRKSQLKKTKDKTRTDRQDEKKVNRDISDIKTALR